MTGWSLSSLLPHTLLLYPSYCLSLSLSAFPPCHLPPTRGQRCPLRSCELVCSICFTHKRTHTHTTLTLVRWQKAETTSDDGHTKLLHSTPSPSPNSHSMHCNYKLLDSFGKSQVLQFKSFLLSHLYRASTNYYCLLSGFLQSNTILTYVCKQLSPYFFSTNLYANCFQWTFLPHCTLNNDWQYVGAQSRIPFLTLTVSLSLSLSPTPSHTPKPCWHPPTHSVTPNCSRSH